MNRLEAGGNQRTRKAGVRRSRRDTAARTDMPAFLRGDYDLLMRPATRLHTHRTRSS
jgi:hypothetical protein